MSLPVGHLVCPSTGPVDPSNAACPCCVPGPVDLQRCARLVHRRPQVDSRQAGLATSAPVQLLLAYLRSSQSTAIVSASCSDNCSCVESSLSAHEAQRAEPATYLHAMVVTQAKECRVVLRVTNAGSGSSNGALPHGFFLTGVIMQDAAAAAAGHVLQNGVWTQAGYHRDAVEG